MDAKELKKCRRILGLKQTELAALLCTPYGTYLHWERGERRIPGVVEVALKTVRFEIEKKRSGQKEGVE